MYILIMAMILNGNGKATTSQQITFRTNQSCQKAAAEVENKLSDENIYFYVKTVCVRVK